MADQSASSSNPALPDAAGSSKKRDLGEREASSSLEHLAVLENVIHHLGLRDMICLGSCSKYLNSFCESDYTWKLLYMKRWGQQASEVQPPQGWKAAYVAKHKERFAKICEILLEVEELIRNDCLNSNNFHIGISKLNALATTYDDIYSFFFSKRLNVIIVILGLYYAFFHFKISADLLKKAMAERGVIDKLVCARWSLPMTWNYGYHMPEETHMRVYCLKHLIDREMSILYLMRQSKKDHYKDKVSNMTISYDIPEPFKCMVCAQEEHLEKAGHVESQHESSSA